MHFYEALEKTQPAPAPAAADLAPAGVTHQDLKDVVNAFQEAMETNKKEILDLIKNSNASNNDVKDNNVNQQGQESEVTQ